MPLILREKRQRMIDKTTLPGASFRIDSANQPREQGSQSEDYMLVADGLLGVFDSVGGRDQGRLVSHLAGRTIASSWQALAKVKQKAPPEHLTPVLHTLLQQADTTIAELSIPEAQRRP